MVNSPRPTRTLGGERAIFDGVGREGARERSELYALRRTAAVRLCRKLVRAGRNGLIKLGARHNLVHEPPLDGALALHAFLGGAEHVGVVAAHLAFVGYAGEPAS